MRNLGHSAFLQQIPGYRRTVNLTVLRNPNLDKFPEPAAIIVPHCFRVSKRLQNRVATQNPFLNRNLPFALILAHRVGVKS